MATDTALRNAGVTIGYAYDLQSCTATMAHPGLGLAGAAKDINRHRARSRALSDLRQARLEQKARRLLERHLTGDDLADWLEMCGIASYEAQPGTGFVPGGRVSEKTGKGDAA